MNLWIVVLSASMIRHQSMKAHGVGPVVAVGFGFDFVRYCFGFGWISRAERSDEHSVIWSGHLSFQRMWTIAAIAAISNDP